MTNQAPPRWLVTYRIAEPDSEIETVTVAASDMVSALKQVQMSLNQKRLADPNRRPFRVTMIEPAPDAPDVPHPVGDPVAALVP
jgi:hypothetical protein